MHALVYLMRGAGSACVGGGFQQAEGHGHAAVMAQSQVGGQMPAGHPLRRPARETVGRRAGIQPHRLDLSQGEGPGQAGAGRFEEGLLGGKVGKKILFQLTLVFIQI